MDRYLLDYGLEDVAPVAVGNKQKRATAGAAYWLREPESSIQPIQLKISYLKFLFYPTDSISLTGYLEAKFSYRQARCKTITKKSKNFMGLDY